MKKQLQKEYPKLLSSVFFPQVILQGRALFAAAVTVTNFPNTSTNLGTTRPVPRSTEEMLNKLQHLLAPHFPYKTAVDPKSLSAVAGAVVVVVDVAVS